MTGSAPRGGGPSPLPVYLTSAVLVRTADEGARVALVMLAAQRAHSPTLGGALVAWGGTLSARRRARRAEAAVRQLTNQVEALQARLPGTAALPPPGE